MLTLPGLIPGKLVMLQCDTPLNHSLKPLASFLKILVLRALLEALRGHCRTMSLSQRRHRLRQCLRLEFESQFAADGDDLKACLSLLSLVLMAVDPEFHRYIYCIGFVLTRCDREVFWISLLWRQRLSYLLIRCQHSFQILVQDQNFTFGRITLNCPEKLFNLLRKLNVILG